MPDFPAGLPDIANASTSETLFTMHGGPGHVASTNRILTNVLQLATKLGITAGPPTPRKVLAGLATAGQSGWVDLVGPVTLLVAASNASAAVKATAQYVCDGTADEVEINAALAALPAVGGTVQLSEGGFTYAAMIAPTKANCTLKGMGAGATILQAATGAVVNITAVALNQTRTVLSDLTIDCNKAGTTGTKTSQRGFALTAANCLVASVRAINSGGNGVDVSGPGARLWNVRVDASDSVGWNVNGPQSGVGVIPSVFMGCHAESCGATANHGWLIDAQFAHFVGCTARASGALGFFVSTLSNNCRLSNCAANGNGSDGFQIAGANTSLVGCAANGNPIGFTAAGSNTQLSGCSAISNSGNAFQSSSGATDVVMIGCDANGNAGASFTLSATRSRLVGCTVNGTGAYGIRVTGGSALVLGNTVVGPVYGIVIEGSTPNIHVDGNEVRDTGQYGILISSDDCKVTNNRVQGSGTSANNTYSQIYVNASRTFIAGNQIRLGAAANRAANGVHIAAGSDNFIGLNDLNGSALTNEVLDAGTNTRRLVKKMLAYSSGSPHSGTAISGSVEFLLIDNQTFRVNSVTSAVMVIVRGGCQVITSTGAGGVSSFLRLDGTAGVATSGTQYVVGTGLIDNSAAGVGRVNPIGGSILTFEGLAVGNHTFKMTLVSEVTGTVYLRGGSIENVNVEVWELSR
jgi:parallel beta-helix repeat protein